MNMQPMTRPIGMVPLARAAALLQGSGKPIHPSNLSRYLDRFPSIPNVKRGKVRMVDFEALAEHRGTNIAVIEKASAVPAQPDLPPPPRPTPLPSDSDDEPDAPRGSEQSGLVLQLKRIQLRQAELDLAEREKRLIKTDEVFRLVSTTMSKFVDALVRQEAEMTQSFGREVGGAFLKARKAAQASASAELAKLAREILDANAAAALTAGNEDAQT